jgi:hypothetical protein
MAGDLGRGQPPQFLGIAVPPTLLAIADAVIE